MNIMNKTFALFIVSLFVMSFVVSATAATAPIPTSDSEHQMNSFSGVPHREVVLSDEGTNVNWYSETGSYNDSWTWDHTDWIFGPRSTYEIYYQNATLLQRNDFIPLNEEVTFKVSVSKGVLKGLGLDSVRVSGNFYVENYDSSFSFDFYNGTSPTWSAYSSTYNYTSETSGPPYLTINEGGCSFTSDANMYIVVFKVTFSGDTPLGLYWLYADAYDTEFNYHEVHSRWYEDSYNSNEVAIGLPYSEAYADNYDGFYSIEKLDLAGDTIFSVSRGTDFMMRLNITGTGDLGYAILYASSPGVEIPVNMTGYHKEQVLQTGGWVFDPELDTYVYNSTVEHYETVTTYGNYTGTDWFYGYPWVDYEYRWLQYFWENDTYVVQHETDMTHDMQLMLIYNFTSGSFETIYGFYYWDYPSDTYVPDLKDEFVFYSLPLEEAPVIFLELNQTLCTTHTVGDVVSVEFVMHFTDQAPKGAMMNFYEYVVDSSGYDYRASVSDEDPSALMTWAEYNEATEIAVESPATIAKLLREDGTPVNTYYFPAKVGEPFIVQGRLQGGSDVADDIDGVLFDMNSYNGYWTETESTYSNIYYEVRVESDFSVVMKAFNLTYKENYTYGSYFDYGTWEEVEGWHWEYFYFNQKTGEWVPSIDWYYGGKSEATAITQDFAIVDQISKYISGGDLYFSFRLNFTSAVPDSEMYWNFQFANYTWVEDPESNYGYHESGQWFEGWIHSFDYSGTDTYVEISTEIGVYSNNSLFTASDWVAVQESPYITIDGVDYPIVVREISYPYSSTAEERLLFNDYNGMYYELLNGTKIYIESRRNAFIFNVTVPGYGSFFSAHDSSLSWYDGTDVYYSWWDIDGNIHQGTDSMTWSDSVTVEVLNVSHAEPSGYYVRVGSSGVLDVKDYERYDSKSSSYYLLGLDDTRYDIIEVDYVRYIMYGGSMQRISYVQRSYETTYMGSPAFIPDEWTLKEQHFIVGTDDEMPYSGAMANYWGVRYTPMQDSEGKVPSSKTIMLDGKSYLLGGDPDTSMWYESDTFNHTGFWVMIESTNISLDGRKMTAAWVNGTCIWNPSVLGVTSEYGHFEGADFIADGTMVLPDEYFVYSDYNYSYSYYYNYRVDFENGTVYSCDPRYPVNVYLVDANGTIVYTRYEWASSETVGNDTVYFVVDLDGVRHYVSDSYLEVLSTEIVFGWDEYDHLGDYSFNFIVNGTQYTDNVSAFGGGLMVFTNGSLVGKYFYESGWGSGHDAQKIYEIPFDSGLYNATAKWQYIFKRAWVEGLALIYDLSPIASVVFQSFHQIIVGNPAWSMWGIKAWTTVAETNALDLDGDPSTTDDQYFVLEEYQSTDSWSSEYSRLWVDLMWDPNGTLRGDEMNIYSWMGWETNTWSYTWQQTFYWYKASDMSPVSSAEFAVINATIFDENGNPLPGYWDIAYAAKNVTWADILAEAEANGWDWMTSNEQTWSWLSFGVGQSYGVYSDTDWVDISLRYEFSGLMIWSDKNNNSIMETSATSPGDAELTHYFIPDSVGSVSFVTPGEAFGNYNASGSLAAGIEDEITWGVTFTDINGTTFPFNSYAYWDWYDGVMTGTDMRTFDERPTKATVDELEFLVHFQGTLNTTPGATTNYAELKVDNTVGNWDVDMVGGIDNLEGRSLSLNYYSDVTVSSFTVRTNDTEVTEESTIASDMFEMVSGNAKFAEMIIGGVTYDWAKDPYSVYNVTSQTTPLSTFRAAYESDNGQSATSWTFSSTQYYVSIGFPQWDGYSVYQDPIFVGYISNVGNEGASDVSFSSFSINPTVPSSTDEVEVGVDISTSLEIWSIDLQYSTDGVNFEDSVVMIESSPGHYVGTIPAFPDDTQVWYRVAVNTEFGYYESEVQSYIVGTGAVTTTTTTTTTTPPPYTGGEGLSSEILLMLGGFGLVVVVIGISAKRRK